MAITYLTLNILFVLVVGILFRVRFLGRAQVVTMVALLVLTVVFDSLIVGLSIVGYDSAKILGIYVGRAPIEDLFYAVFAGLIIPQIWERLGGSNVTDH